MTPAIFTSDRLPHKMSRRFIVGAILASSLIVNPALAQYNALELTSEQRSISFELPAMLAIEKKPPIRTSFFSTAPASV